MEFKGDTFNVKISNVCECNSFPLVLVRMSFPDVTNKEFLINVCNDIIAHINIAVPSKNFMIYNPTVLADGMMFSTADKFIVPITGKILIRLAAYKDISIKQFSRVEIDVFGLTGRFMKKITDKTSKLYAKSFNVYGKIAPPSSPKYEVKFPGVIQTMSLKEIPNKAAAGMIKIAIANFCGTVLNIKGNEIEYISQCPIDKNIIKNSIKELVADINKACKADCLEKYFKFVTGEKYEEIKGSVIKF